MEGLCTVCYAIRFTESPEERSFWAEGWKSLLRYVRSPRAEMTVMETAGIHMAADLKVFHGAS